MLRELPVASIASLFPQSHPRFPNVRHVAQSLTPSIAPRARSLRSLARCARSTAALVTSSRQLSLFLIKTMENHGICMSGASWGALGRVWASLGRLGASLERLGASLRRLGASLGRLGVCLGRSGAPFWLPLAPCGDHFVLILGPKGKNSNYGRDSNYGTKSC